MDEFLGFWFQGFEKGLDNLDDEARGKLFCECGRNCAKSGVLEAYRKLYEDAEGDMDKYFESSSQLGEVSGEVVESGKQYKMYFPRCLCDLHNRGFVNSSHLCECSRQSILFVLNTIMPEHTWKVEIVETVLGGAKRCEMLVTRGDAN